MKFKTGDRVHVEFDGTVIDDAYETRVLVNSDLETGNYMRYSLPVEAVTRIEPEYEDGAMYLSAGGFFYHRTQGKWRSARNGDFVADYYPTRPLRKLVPEGE